MSKIAKYLQEHIQGEVITNPATLASLSTDASILEVTPEMAVYPRVTNDIRKVARFAWQLAEKGHVMSLTMRGGGSDQTGAAIGAGIIISSTAHMNSILEFDSKQKLIRVQPGLNAKSLDDALFLNGMGLPALPPSSAYSTVGGAVANNASSPLSGQQGSMADWTHQLEVVLSNGDILQTERISKRELSRKKGMQTFEGEIYRTIDNLIEDNKQMIDEKLGGSARDNTGYSSIAKVKNKDGSFDLTPLIVGSQGTLGIVSEMILKVDFVSRNYSVAVAAFHSQEDARDLLDKLREQDAAILEYFDSELFKPATDAGKLFDFLSEDKNLTGAVVMVGFNDFNERSRARKLKKVLKLFEGAKAEVRQADGADADELLSLRDALCFNILPVDKEYSTPALFDGCYVPHIRFEDFQSALSELGKKYAVSLPIHSRVNDGIIYVRPSLQLKKVGDKQKIFKLLDEFSLLVASHGGHLAAEAGEGRLMARFAYKQLDDDVVELFTAIREAFDPFGILNPEVKQVTEVRQLVSELAKNYSPGKFSGNILAN